MSSSLPHLSDIEIARQARMKPIQEIADNLGIPSSALEHYGHYKAKITNNHIATLANKPEGKLILVTAMTPTAAGEGKTTTTVGLGDGLNRIGRKTIIALREPSLGPAFGMKGGAAGGGYAQVVPMEDINLHFTGDFHAITSAHNLLAAMIDNHIYWGNKLGMDQRRIVWRRVLDLNDRSLRRITGSLGGIANGFPREDGFDITVASEIMAIFCLTSDLDDLKRRLGQITVAYTGGRRPVHAKDLQAVGAMAVLLKDALKPNLVQTLENNPALIHGGPFANIAHGCSSVIATKAALKLADYVVTEAGFGADLGAEKFFDIKCRKAGLRPDCVVVVATVRALKMHGGLNRQELEKENPGSVELGLSNLKRHLENLDKYAVPAVVALNRFACDTDAEVEVVKSFSRTMGVPVVDCTHWAEGSSGTTELAHKVAKMLDEDKSGFRFLYPDTMPVREKIETITREIYRADGISLDAGAERQLCELQSGVAATYPVCVAKTQYSFSSNPELKGAPEGYIIPVREIRLSSGAEFILVLTGNIMTMPGLPSVPAAHAIDLDADGKIVGLF